MRSSACLLLLVAVSMVAATATGATRRALSMYINKPFIPPRPDDPIVRPDDPIVEPAPAPESSEGETGGSSPGAEPGDVAAIDNLTGQSSGLGADGTSSYSTNPFTDDEDSAEDDELREEALDAIKEVFDKISDLVQNALPSSTSTSTTITSFTDAGFPTTTAANSAVNTASNRTDGSRNATHDAAHDPRLPSVDIANMLAQGDDLQSWSDVLTSDEYEMYQDSPLCFYANVERMYSSASASAATSAKTNDTAPTSTSGPTKRSLDSRQSDLNQTCVNSGLDVTGCSMTSGSPQRNSSFSQTLSRLWASVLPSHLSSIHLATPIVLGSVTGTMVSTTSCPGLDGLPGPVTSYRELKISAVATPSAQPTLTGSGAAIGSVDSMPKFLLSTSVVLTLLWMGS